MMVPPEPGRLYVVLSDPRTLTEVALVAVTVNVSEPPGLIELCAAVIEIVGGPVPGLTVIVVCEVALPLPFVAVAV